MTPPGGSAVTGPDTCRALIDSARWLAVELDREGRLEQANPAFFALAGTPPSEAIGRDWFELFIPEREREEARRRYRAFLSERAPLRLEGALITARGEVRRIAWDCIVRADADGRVIGSASLGADVTDHGLAERALHDSEARYRAIIDLAVDAIITIDDQGVMDSFNRAAARIFGYPPEEVIGQNVRLLMPSPYREEHDDYIRRYLATGKAKIIGRGREVLGRRKDGSVFPIDLAVSEVRFGGRRTFTGIVRDISARRRAEVLASTATLASGMAHEIGTPLNVILGRAERARERLGESEAARDLDIIIAQVERVSRIIQQLLAISRPHPLERRPTQVNQVARRTLEVLEERLRRRQVQLVTELAPDLPPVPADPDRLSQVILNLAVNALDALGPGGTLRVATAPAALAGGEGVEIRVSDDGCGIAPEHLPHIFDPFFTTKSEGRGSGLGLAVVLGILRDHGGTIDVESEAGRGTTFIVRLPLATAGPARPASDPA